MLMSLNKVVNEVLEIKVITTINCARVEQAANTMQRAKLFKFDAATEPEIYFHVIFMRFLCIGGIRMKHCEQYSHKYRK